MKQRRVVTVCVLLLVGLVAHASAQASRPFTQSQVRSIETAISTKMASASIPGLSMAIVWNGKLAWTRGFGMSDLENFVPAKSSTIYRLGSISKPITATAVMQLAERGNLSLDAPAQQYCPAFPAKQWPITTRLLLKHQAGIRHYRGIEEIDITRHYPNVSGGLAVFKDDPLLFKPGTSYTYTSFGYNLLGCVIEGASGATYTDFVKSNILQPAGMTTAQVDDVSELVPNRARGYVIENKRLRNSHLVDTSYKIPSGGWISSVEDLARFAIAILDRRLLPDSVLQQMWSVQDSPGGGADRYGSGWQLGNRNGMREVLHTGGQQGTSTILLMIPEKNFAVVVMTNLESSGPSELARQVSDILLQPSK